MKYNFIEVCAGAGGLSSGLIQAGFKPLFLNDFNKDCCETLRQNHKHAIVKCCKMQDLAKDPEIVKFRGKIDLLIGGVPCQSFSQAGKRKGLDDPRGELILHFITLINVLKPRMWMIENVRGLATHNSGKTLEFIINMLNESGKYTVHYSVLNAVNFSVPQKRERIFIAGVLTTSGAVFSFPEPCKKIISLSNVLKNVPESLGAIYSSEKCKLFKKIPPGGCWINLPVKEQKAYMGSSFYSGGGKRGILRRLSMNEPSLTLLCTPSQKQTERCHPTEERPLTIREYARIQTFPDTYSFYGNIASQYRQIGNAVPIQLAKRIGIQLNKCLKQF
jgi:DNA (cytosine-5)-methyltransferase 1